MLDFLGHILCQQTTTTTIKLNRFRSTLQSVSHRCRDRAGTQSRPSIRHSFAFNSLVLAQSVLVARIESEHHHLLCYGRMEGLCFLWFNRIRSTETETVHLLANSTNRHFPHLPEAEHSNRELHERQFHCTTPTTRRKMSRLACIGDRKVSNVETDPPFSISSGDLASFPRAK